MILRLYHFFRGHQWNEQWSYCPPSNPEQRSLFLSSDYFERYGFMVWFRSCVCGAHKTKRIVGHLATVTDDLELRLLRKMAGV